MNKRLPPVPRAALPMLRYIRERVPRPKELPLEAISIYRHCLRFRPYGRCPMGLLPGAHAGPFCYQQIPGLPLRLRPSVKPAGRWWDSLRIEHAPAAMDRIWGKEKRRG